MKRTFRLNFLSIVACEFAWGFGIPLVSISTVLPLLVIQLGGNALHVGLLNAIQSAAYLFSVFSPLIFTHAKTLKKRVVKTFILGTNGFLLMGLAPLAVYAGLISPATGLVCVMVCYLLTRGSNMMAGMGYRSLIAGSLDPGRRLSDYGRIFFFGLIMGVPGGYIAGRLHGTADVAPLVRYGVSIFMGFLLLQVGNFSLVNVSYLRERSSGELRVRTTWRDAITHPVFRRYLFPRALMAVQVVLAGFLAAYARQELGYEEGAIAAFAGWQLAGVAIGALVWGRLGQRTTAVHPLALGAACVALALPLAVFCHARFALWIAIFLDGAAMSACWVSDYGLPIVLVGEHEAIPFYSLQVIVAEGVRFVLALLAGFTIRQVGFAPAALPAAGVAAVCCVVLLRFLASVPREKDANTAVGDSRPSDRMSP